MENTENSSNNIAKNEDEIDDGTLVDSTTNGITNQMNIVCSNDEESQKLFDTIENKLRSLQSDEVTTSFENNNNIKGHSVIVDVNLNNQDDKQSMEIDEDVLVIRDSMDFEVIPEQISDNIVLNTSLDSCLPSIDNFQLPIQDNDEIFGAKDIIHFDIIKNIPETVNDPIAKNEIEDKNKLEIDKVVDTHKLAKMLKTRNQFTLSRDMNNILPLLSYGLICSECKQDITDKEKHLTWECMDFCNVECLTKYQTVIGKQCANCNVDVSSSSLGKYCVRFGSDIRQFCKSTCLDTFKRDHKVCGYCQTFITFGQIDGISATVGATCQFKDFCSQVCMEKYYKMSNGLTKTNAICVVCNETKLIHTEVEVDDVIFKLCSEPCFIAFKFANNVISDECRMCRKHFEQTTLDYTIYLDDVPYNFCGKTCLNVYIISNRKIVACHWCKVKKYNFDMIKKRSINDQSLMVCSVNCLALCSLSISSISVKNSKCVINLTNEFNNISESSSGNIDTNILQIPMVTNGSIPLETPSMESVISISSSPCPPLILKTQATSPIPHLTPKYIKQLVVKPPPLPQMKNKATMCKPNMHTKGVSFKPHVNIIETQINTNKTKSILLPVPVPIYVPTPMIYTSTPFPMPVPFPLPVPVPIFIPTTKNSANGILKEIKKIQINIPNDPYEAELLMMAEMVAGDKKLHTDSENDDDDTAVIESEEPSLTNHDRQMFGDDLLQMALNMASESIEPAIDLEGALITNTISVNQLQDERGQKQRKRQTTSAKQKKVIESPSKVEESPSSSSSPQDYVDDPTDAGMCLKYSFGVNAWKQWVSMKNIDLEKTSRRFKSIKPDILQLSADELNYSLALFITEIRKPNETEYAPDTIFYLCLGIQYYLYKNGRVDNIFTDIFYEKFTECLDTIAKMFSVLYNDSHYIVTRVEEEHLWESKQLGAHSPQVLLNTLIFFNTKYFNLVTVDDHMQLSFSHIMKHWKRNSNQSGGSSKTPGVSRNVLLRYYPSPSAIKSNMKKVYEQEENEENPLRCPVKLYEFYLSKCPESVKTRNDVFYLSPERSCLPDSPVWYSTLALHRHALEKMLHRVKMVKEINVALLRG